MPERRWWVLCLVVTLVPAGAVWGASAGESGFVLLREGVGPRAAAMGEAYTAVVGDQTAAYWNPAGVAALGGKDFLLTHHRSFQGIQQTYAGWGYGNGSRGVALSLAVHSVGGLETRMGPSAEPLGTFNMYEVNGGFSYAQRIGRRVHVGLAGDIGLLITTPVEGLALGAAYRNLGRMGRLDRERVPLPRTFRAGVALSRGPIVGSLDLRLPEEGERGLNMGLEYGVGDRLYLRGGYRTGSETRDLSFGIGLQQRNWRIDYAYVPSDLGLGGSHRIGLGIR